MSAVPAVPVAAVVMMAVNCILLASTALGVKVATVFAAFMLTLPATLLPLIVSLTVKETAGETMVAGFIASLKVALMVLGITTLPGPTALTATLMAPLAGFEEETAGLLAVPDVPDVPVAPVVLDGKVPGAMAPGAPGTESWLMIWMPVPLSPPPSPHPATIKASSNAINHSSDFE